MARQRPVHYLHYEYRKYHHTYCNLINYSGYMPWSFTRVIGQVTCKRCLMAMNKDNTVVDFKYRLKQWAERRR